MQRHTERSKRFENALGIFRLRPNPGIQVTGCTNITVNGKRVRAYQEVFNAVRVEFGQ